MQLKQGHKLQNGKYRIDAKIGQGGFGITYRAFWNMKAQGAMGAIDTEIQVVIKEFFWKDYCNREDGASHVSISSATGKDMFDRFKEKLKKEGKILSRFEHPNIVRVLDIFEENNTAYVVMQLIEGESLSNKITRMGKLDESAALKYTLQLCSALQEVHRQRILHLDVKPSNVIIDNGDNARLLDFGISKQYNDSHQETSTTPVGISKGYTPLEQYSGIETFSPSADIYALGATLYKMLTGKTPVEATLSALESQEPVRRYNAAVSDRTLAVVNKAMQTKPSERFQTVEQIVQALNSGSMAQETIVEKPKSDSKEKEPAAPPQKPKPEVQSADDDEQKKSPGMVFFLIGALIIAAVITLFAILPGTESVVQEDAVEATMSFEDSEGVSYSYSGELLNGLPNGYGKAVFSGAGYGKSYEGDFVNGFRHGKGKMTFANKTVYEGNYVNDKADGQGTMTYPTGERYVGQWKNDLQNGEGVYYDASGNTVYKGQWKNGEIKEQ